MADRLVTLKGFQQQALTAVRHFGIAWQRHGDAERAFVDAGGIGQYQHPPSLAAPCICLGIPTGGGKTLMAACAAGEIAQHALHRQPLAIVWLVPSTTIAEQTLRALGESDHPLHQAVTNGVDGFGGLGSVRVLTVAQALRQPTSIYHTANVIIVATVQQFRIGDPSARYVYAANDLLADEHGTSLVEQLAHRRPLLIVDEAHNARTPLSFAALERLQPGFVLELTATPARTPWPSNLIARADALTLKQEHLLKLPIELQTTPDVDRCLAAASACREQLAHAARHSNGPYVRPILLIQAQARHSAQAWSPELVRDQLLALGVAAEAIAIATGEQRDLSDVDLSSPECLITHIITVEALREGWDCPFASVLCTLRAHFTTTAATQLIGRILRQPYGQPHPVDVLNRCYAFAAASDFDEALAGMRSCLEHYFGFSAAAAAAAIVSPSTHTATLLGPPNPPFIIPTLVVPSAEDATRYVPCDETRLLQLDWRLSPQTARLSPGDYLPGDGGSHAAQIDLDDDGNWISETRPAGEDPAPLYTQAALLAWLERRLRARDIHPDDLQAWITSALTHLQQQRGIALDILDRDRWHLAKVLHEFLQREREQAERTATDILLKQARCSDVDHNFNFERYVGDTHTANRFQHHLYPSIAPFDSAMEARAAETLDNHPRIRRWVRNPVGPDGFALPRRPLNGRRWYYPDFIAECHDGPLLLVEVKGSHLGDTIDTQDKIAAASQWATCTGHGFALVVDDDVQAIFAALESNRIT